MAQGKKSFLIYADLLQSVDHLNNDELGELFRHMLLYVNDEHPTLDNRLLLTAWKPIQRVLKADLKKWEETREKRQKAGRKGGLAKASNANQSLAKLAVSDSVSVSVSSKEDLVKGFLNWFNQQKELHTGSLGKFKVLSNTDQKNLKQLKGAYNDEDFNKAVAELYQSQWAKDTNNRTPSHFLRVDNFNRYVSAELVSNTPQRKKLNPIAANTALSNPNIMEEYLEQGWTKAEIQLISQGKHTGE
jgi:hypothetical protein